MKKNYLVYILLIANFTFAQKFLPSTLDSINNQLKGKDTKDRCLYFLEKADYYSNTNTNYYYLYGKEALKQAVKSEDNTLLSLASNTLGNVFQKKTQLDSSLFYHRQALLIRQNEKDTIGIADSYNNIGIAFDSQGDFDNALKQYFKALPFYEKKQMDEKTAMTSVNIGVVYETQKEYKKAYFYYKKANELYTKLKSEFGTTVTAGNLGAILINFKGYNKSLEYSKQAKAGYEKLGYKSCVAYTLSNIAVVYDSLHRFEEANKNYIASITLHEEFANNFEVANICNTFSNCLIKQKKYPESIIYAQKALRYAKVADTKFGEICALKNLAKAYGKLGTFEKAYYYSSLYTKGMDQLFKSEKTKAVFEIEAKYENEKKTKLLLQIQNKIQKRNTLILILALLIISIGLISFLIYRQQKIKRLQQAQKFELKSAIAAVESKNKLREQRISISRDLHDNIGAQLTFIISSINNIKHAFDINNSKLEDKLQSISSFTKSTIVELRDTIWAMSIEQVSLEDLKLRIFDFIEKARLAVESTQFNFHIASDLLTLYFSSIDGMNIYRIIQEAVHNSLKYAKATEINVNFSKENNFIIAKIIDNGTGFEPDSVVLGNGIHSIKKRIKELHGTFDINSQINVGTTLTIRLPYKKFEL
jgi:signal transduction histidine kinase